MLQPVALPVLRMRQLEEGQPAGPELLQRVSDDPAAFRIGKPDMSRRTVDDRDADTEAIQKQPRNRDDFGNVLPWHIEADSIQIRLSLAARSLSILIQGNSALRHVITPGGRDEIIPAQSEQPLHIAA